MSIRKLTALILLEHLADKLSPYRFLGENIVIPWITIEKERLYRNFIIGR
jgi:hypothetical protein